MSAHRSEPSPTRGPTGSRLSRLDTTTASGSSATTPTSSTNRHSESGPTDADENDVSSAAYRNLASSQASLLRATSALEETFSRIRILRDHIAARRNGSSASAEGTQTADASMGPDHNAIRRRTISETITLIEDLRAQLEAQRPESVLTTLREGRAALDQAGPRTAVGDTPTQPQARRTSTLTSTAPLRFGPRSENSASQLRLPQHRPVPRSHLRPQREGSTARAAASQPDSSEPSILLDSAMDDLRRDIPHVWDRIHSLESPDAREPDAHWISQQNSSINSLVQEARALGVPLDSEIPAVGQRPTERTASIDFPSPITSSWFSPNPALLSSAATSLPTTTSTNTPGTSASIFQGFSQPIQSESERQPTFNERIAQLDAEMERQRERQWRLLATISARQDASTSTRDEARGIPFPSVPPDDSTSESLAALEARFADAMENINAMTPGPGSSFETLRAMSSREDEDPFSWLMPSRTPPAREPEPRRTSRSIWPTRAAQSTSAYPFSENMTVFEGGRAPRDRGGQRAAAPVSGRVEVAPTNLGSARRRRRGWARLDQDGNEIPTDEEEEYERNRTQMRARALQLTSNQPPERLTRASSTTLPPPPPPAGRRLSFVPTTQSQGLFWPSSDADVRVRINTARDLPSTEPDRPVTPRDDSDDDEYWKDVPAGPQTIGSSAPFVPSLLPLPRVDLSGTPSAAVKSKKLIWMGDPLPIYCAGR
ncbi:uncharacterized protein B0H18DRAFT_1020960 [Fomitopsis serialis]|uniref:uncharacterized protein n=1 Tax=Fomitopsis serialis TaxID=139415 RepID=UPI00200836FB|nr:uncharacterized protein B0H18DRAFT_1020960 [Neoantrodia serialis]KAH9921416.1 hypothetical protein B0H18DRAFT_1020960 [Neoantrodia serialis]